MPITENELDLRFDRHLPVPETNGAIEGLHATFKETARIVVEKTPESREQSLAITALEEALSWAVAGVERHRSKETAQIDAECVNCGNPVATSPEPCCDRPTVRQKDVLGTANGPAAINQPDVPADGRYFPPAAPVDDGVRGRYGGTPPEVQNDGQDQA